MDGFVNTSIDETSKVYSNVFIRDSVICSHCSIGDDSTLVRVELGNNVIINRRNYINDSSIGNYSYTGINTIINFSILGKFCSIARNVDIGGDDHDYHKVSMFPEYRVHQIIGHAELSGVKKNDYCVIGSDVWIGAGAIVLGKVKIGDGAVIGGGAVVTKDVPPYAIVVGVPAKIIGYRCSQENINELLRLKWWDWPDAVLLKHMKDFIEMDINDETISCMKSIYENEVLVNNPN